MQKTQIAIVILVLIALFATADYVLNAPKQDKPSAPEITGEVNESSEGVQALISRDPATLDYKILQRNRVTQLFERIDLSGLKEVKIYKNILQKESSFPIILYEIQGADGQGALNYLSVKSALTAKMGAEESLNEDSAFGQNSFYFNDSGAPDAAFLVVHMGDSLLGFQFVKAGSEDFEAVKAIIRAATK